MFDQVARRLRVALGRNGEEVAFSDVLAHPKVRFFYHWFSGFTLVSLLILINGFFFINLDGWRYSGATGGAPAIAPVMLSMFNLPAYSLFGVWGEAMLQVLVFSYVIARILDVMELRIGIFIMLLWLALSNYIFYVATFNVDGWTPVLLFLVIIIGRSKRLSPIDAALLVVASGAHNAHLIIGLATVLGGILLGVIVKRRVVLVLIVLASLPVNLIGARILHPDFTQALRFSFVASDIIMKEAGIHQDFCVSHADNALCMAPYRAFIDLGRAAGGHDFLWGPGSLIQADNSKLGKDVLTYTELERASRGFVTFVIVKHPTFIIQKAVKSVLAATVVSPMYDAGWNNYVTATLRDASFYWFMRPYVPQIEAGLQASSIFTSQHVLDLGSGAAMLCYLLYGLSLLSALLRRDWLGLRIGLLCGLLFIGAALTYGALTVMYGRYYYRSLVVLGLPVLYQMQALWVSLAPPNEGSARDLKDTSVNRLAASDQVG